MATTFPSTSSPTWSSATARPCASGLPRPDDCHAGRGLPDRPLARDPTSAVLVAGDRRGCARPEDRGRRLRRPSHVARAPRRGRGSDDRRRPVHPHGGRPSRDQPVGDRRVPGQGHRLDPAGPTRAGGRPARHHHVRRRGPAREPRHDQRLPGERIHGLDPGDPGLDRGGVPDPADRRGRRPVRAPRDRGGGERDADVPLADGRSP